MLGDVSKSRRRLAKRTQPRKDHQDRSPAASSSATGWIAGLSVADLLERISRARLHRDELDAELALLVDRAVNLRIGWPEIAAQPKVCRSRCSVITHDFWLSRLRVSSGRAGLTAPASSLP